MGKPVCLEQNEAIRMRFLPKNKVMSIATFVLAGS